MSWFIKAIGTPAAVKAKIQKDPCLAPSLKTALCEMCDDKPWDGSPQNGIAIEGSGHSGQGSSITSLKVERFEIAPEPPAPPVATPAEPVASS
jgi:hypothetical protein